MNILKVTINMLYLRLLFLLMVIMPLYPSCTLGYTDPWEEPIYGKIADKITARTIKILSERHNMCADGIGGGFIDHVNMLALSFQIYRPLTLESAREIIVDCIEEYLFQINSNEEIRPYLKNYPFTSAEVEISIYSYSQHRERVYDPYITLVTNIVRRKSGKSALWYCTEAPDQPYEYKNEIFEDYQEALRLVKGKNVPE